MSGTDESLADYLIEDLRRAAGRGVEPEHRSTLGQFMTPLTIARFMAGLFSRWDLREIRLLDAGAGAGSLTAAFLDEWIARGPAGAAARATAYEIDPGMRRHLVRTLTAYGGAAAVHGLTLRTDVPAADFIQHGSELLLPLAAGPRFTHAILNPPYTNRPNS